MSNRAVLERKYAKGRSNLLLVALLSTVNVALQYFDADISFLFSASFPMISLIFGRSFAELYSNQMWLTAGMALAVLAIGLYVLCHVFSKKHSVFMLVALILFSVDSLFLIWLLTFGVDTSLLVDMAFHVWVIVALASGVKAASELKKLPPEEEIDAASALAAENPADYPIAPIRPQNSKGRVLISYSIDGVEILAKRTGIVTELIVNGMVYMEKRGFFEGEYVLCARVDDKLIKVTMDLEQYMSLFINGVLITKKKRVWMF